MVNRFLVVLVTFFPSGVTLTLLMPAPALIVKRTPTVLEVHARLTPATPTFGFAKSSLTIVPVPPLPIAAGNGLGPPARLTANVSSGSIAVSPVTFTVTGELLVKRAMLTPPAAAV